MSVYVLDNDEAIILKAMGVHVKPGSATVDLILTNKNIIQVNKGFFGGDKDAEKFPLTDLRILDGKPNVRLGKSKAGEKQLEMYFTNREIFYVFDGIFTENNWANAVTKAYKKRVSEIEKEEDNYSSLLKSLKDKVIGERSTKKEKKRSTRTCKCQNCGAEIIGIRGDEVKCAYCDALVRIK